MTMALTLADIAGLAVTRSDAGTQANHADSGTILDIKKKRHERIPWEGAHSTQVMGTNQMEKNVNDGTSQQGIT